MAAAGHDDTKPVAEGKEHQEDTGRPTEEAKAPADGTNDRVEGARKLVEEAKKSVENLMKSVEEDKKEEEAARNVKGSGDVVGGDGEAGEESTKPGEKEVDSTRAAEVSTPAPENASELEKDEIRSADGGAPTAHRPATPIPFSRTSDGTRTPVSLGRITPEDSGITPRAPRTPPPLTTRSLGRLSNDGLKTPSDMSGRWTPSTPKTPGHASSADSIRRKPVPAPSSDNLRERSASTLKNPLEKTTVTIMPDRLGEKAPSTPDSTPRTHISLRGSKKKGVDWKRVGRLWWVEGAWCSASLLCIIIIFAVLSAYDSHPVSTLPLNLPALLALFTTAAILSLIVPVRECISQWKWNHLRADTRSLFDFQLFDSASRSPLGAAELLVKLRQTHIARVGAVILLLSLTAPAITQVAIGYREGTMAADGGEASVSATRILEGNIEGLGPAVEHGVKGGVDLNLPVSCQTGRCDFEPFEALGICTEVHDVSDKLDITSGSRRSGNSTDRPVSSGSSYNVSLPEEANCRFMTSDPRNVMACKTGGTATLSFGGDLKDTAIYSMPIIYSNPADDSDEEDVEFEALEVLFHLCLNTYSASVRQSQPGFKVVKSSAALASGSNDRTVDVECDAPIHAGSEGAVECEAEDVPSDAVMKLGAKGEGSVEVSASFELLGEVAVAMGEELVGLWMREGDDEPSIVGTPRMEDISKVVYGGEAKEQKDRVTKMAGSIATSLTNAMSAKEATDDTSPNVIAISGASLHPQTLIAINYAPLSLLLILALSSLGFLIATAILTERDAGMEVLKSSALASLFALEEECRGVAGGLESVESMGRKARVMHVRLRDEAIVLAGESEEGEKTEDV